MKLSIRFCLLVAALAGFGGANAFAKLVQVPLPRLATIQAVASNNFMVSGEIVTRNEIEFTMIVRNSELMTVQVTNDTAILRGAESIRLSDLNVGEKVVVTVMRGAEGKLLAVNVTVRDTAGE